VLKETRTEGGGVKDKIPNAMNENGNMEAATESGIHLGSGRICQWLKKVVDDCRLVGW
jgi:hypothetical protein